MISVNIVEFFIILNKLKQISEVHLQRVNAIEFRVRVNRAEPHKAVFWPTISDFLEVPCNPVAIAATEPDNVFVNVSQRGVWQRWDSNFSAYSRGRFLWFLYRNIQALNRLKDHDQVLRFLYYISLAGKRALFEDIVLYVLLQDLLKEQK